jgi:hypothetical protein
MAAKYKNPPIWAKFGLQVDLAIANWWSSSFLELGDMGWGDVRHCFAMAILVIIIILIVPLFSSASIFSGTFLGNRTVDPFETGHKNLCS